MHEGSDSEPRHSLQSTGYLTSLAFSLQPGHRYIELFLNSRDEPPMQQPPPPGASMPPRGPGGGPPRFMAPQQQQPSWGDRSQVSTNKKTVLSILIPS